MKTPSYEELEKRIKELERENTELRKLEVKLRESEEKWHSLTENTDDTIVITDNDDVIQYINKTIPPQTPEEVIGKSVYKYVMKEHHNVMRKSLEKVYKTGKPDSYEVSLDMSRINPKIGTLWFNTKVVPIKTDKGISSVIMIATDITERKKAEESLRESEENYRALADSISDTFFAMDKDLRYTYWNKASEKLTGIEAKDAIGKSIFDVFPDTEDTRRTVSVYQEVLKTKKSKSFVNEYRLGGKTYFFEISAYPFKKGLSVFAKDITEKKKAEKEKERLMHNLRERVKELDCLYTLSKLIEKPDISLEDIYQETVNIIPPSWQYPEITCARIVVDGGEFITDNFKDTKWKLSADIIVSREKVGSVEVFYLEEKPIIDEVPFLKEERNLIDTLGRQMGNIIEKKKLEEERVKRSNLEAINNLIVTINHEMNQPLSVITSYSNHLMKDNKEDSQTYKDSKLINDEAWRLAKLVKKIGKLKELKTTVYSKGVKMIDLSDIDEREKNE